MVSAIDFPTTFSHSFYKFFNNPCEHGYIKSAAKK